MKFNSYMKKFEEAVYEGVNAGVIGKSLLVNVRNGKFSKGEFAKVVGGEFDYPTSFILDYYGYLKKSTGFLKEIEEKKKSLKNRQIKSIGSIVVFFAALKIEDMCEITSSHYLIANFPIFKQYILEQRGFK